MLLIGKTALWNAGSVVVVANKSLYGLCDTRFGMEEADVVCR